MITTLISPEVSGAISTIKIYPSDDVFVRDRYPDTNYQNINWERELRSGYVSTFGNDKSYLKFNLSSISQVTFNSAFLVLEVESNQENPVLEIRSVSSNSWYEETLTWNTAPVVGPLIFSISNPPLEKIKIDVSSYLSGDQVSFAIVENGGTGISTLSSKEKGMDPTDNSRWPYLEVTYETGFSCTTTADISENGSIDMSELLNYISKWKLKQVTMSSLIDAINYWKLGVGC